MLDVKCLIALKVELSLIIFNMYRFLTVLNDIRVEGMKTVHENIELTLIDDLRNVANFVRGPKSKFLR